MPKKLFDSRELEFQALFSHRFTRLGVHQWRSELRPELEGEVHVIRPPDGRSRPEGESWYAFILVSTQPPQDPDNPPPDPEYIIERATGHPVVIFTETDLHWSYQPGKLENVAFDVVGEDPAELLDSRVLRTNDRFGFMFADAGTFEFRAYARSDDGTGGPEETVTGRIEVSFDHPPPENPIIIELPPESLAWPVIRIPPGASIAWQPMADCWYVECFEVGDTNNNA